MTPSVVGTTIVAAPMAGGPSTPELVAAVARAGGFGFLAAGYQMPGALATQVERVRASGAPFGVNVFVPDEDPIPAEVARFRERLLPLAARYGVGLPEPHPDDDHYAAKLDLLRDARPDVVSFTFGCPEREVLRGFRELGVSTMVTVTSAAAARQAAEAGVSALCVQGLEAGGHRSTFTVAEEPEAGPLLDLIREVRAVTDLPVVAAGGLMDAGDVAGVLAAGAVAAQCGTAFLLADEAGTSPTHRAALVDPAFTATRVTRAFSGRYARGLANAWMDEFADAPAAYPAVNQVTSPVRKAAAESGDAQYTHLWAGVGWKRARAGSAVEILARLRPEVAQAER